MRRIVAALLVCVFLNGCATSTKEMLRCIIGNSTKELEDSRKDAVTKVFDYSYEICFAKVEKILKDMPNLSIYSKDTHMIALFYTRSSTTEVGVFFTEIDPTHTKVEISSASPSTKEWIAKNLFSETVLKEKEKASLKL